MPPEITIANALKAVKKKHVIDAIGWIDRTGYVPKRRNSTRYSLIRHGRRYPPKYVLAIAVHRATGCVFSPNEHSGGKQSNEVLQRLKFKVIAGRTDWPER
jgi:hypothetical protein